MRLTLSVLVLALSSLAIAQPTNPSVDIFGGYSYLNIDTNGLTNRISANGWEASVSTNLINHIAAEAAFAGYYKSATLFGITGTATDYSFAGGPRFNYKFIFAHFLFGTDRATGSVLGFSASQNSFAVVLGGGAQVPVAPHWSIRAGGDWVGTNHNIFGGPGVSQNNFRTSVGVVYTLGGKPASAYAKAHEQEPERTCGAMAASPRSVTLNDLGLAGWPNSYGFHITAVTPGGPADKAGLVVDDSIVSVNCIQVHSAAELTTAVGRAASPALIEVNKPVWLPNRTEEHRLVIGGQ